MDLSIAIKQPDTQLSDRKASEALAWANALVIASNADYSMADQFCRGLFSLRKEIELDFADSEAKAKEAKRAATAALAAVVEQKEGHVVPVFQSEKILKSKMLAWSQAEESKRQIAEAQAREEAKKRAEDELLRKAAALEASGEAIRAEAMLQKPVKVAPVVLPPSTPKATTRISVIKKYKIINVEEVKREFCSPDAGKIWKAVQLYGKQAEEIVGGVSYWEEAS